MFGRGGRSERPSIFLKGCYLKSPHREERLSRRRDIPLRKGIVKGTLFFKRKGGKREWEEGGIVWHLVRSAYYGPGRIPYSNGLLWDWEIPGVDSEKGHNHTSIP